MSGIDKGLSLVSVADVLFFNPVTDEYMGDGFALTDSTITQEVQTLEQRGGYLNGLIYWLQHSKNLTVALTSATFKMEYLAFQTGTPLVTGTSNVYQFSECVTFTNGVGTVAKTPVGDVYVRLPNGLVKAVVPAGKSVNTGLTTFSGETQVTYMYNKEVTQTTIDTKTQPLTVKAVMKIHAFTQDGIEKELQITIPRLKFNGSINLSLTADGMSSFDLGGTALEYTTSCGESLYADVKLVSLEDATNIAVEDIVASPNVLELSLAGAKTAIANIIGLRTSPYSNVRLDNTKVTFQSSKIDTVSVGEDGLITGLKQGDAQITVSYEGLQDIISVFVVA